MTTTPFSHPVLPLLIGADEPTVDFEGLIQAFIEHEMIEGKDQSSVLGTPVTSPDPGKPSIAEASVVQR